MLAARTAEGADLRPTAPDGLVTREQAVPSRVVSVQVLSSFELVSGLHQAGLHASMPRGAIELFWGEVKARGMACFHVARVHEGRTSWLVAVLLRIDVGYLAIHLRPSSPELLVETVERYEQTREVEAAAAEAGASAADAGRAGARHLANSLRDNGFTVARACTRLLETEVMPASLRATGKPRSPGAFGPLAAMQQALFRMRQACDVPARGLNRMVTIGELLQEESDAMGYGCDELQVMSTAAMFCAVENGPDASVLRSSAEALDRVGVRSLVELTYARGALEEARQRLAHLRWWVAGARLLIDVTAADVDERLGRGDGPGLEDSFVALCSATQSAVIEMAVGLTELPALLQSAAERLDAAITELEDFHRWLSRYRLLVTKAQLWSQLPELTAELDRQLAGVDGLRRQRQAAEQLRQFTLSADLEELAIQLEAMRTAQIGAQAWPSGRSGGREITI